MIRPRRFIVRDGVVVEIEAEPITPSGGELHDRARQEYNSDRQGKAATLRAATLERAERREFAHKAYGNESRWRE